MTFEDIFKERWKFAYLMWVEQNSISNPVAFSEFAQRCETWVKRFDGPINITLLPPDMRDAVQAEYFIRDYVTLGGRFPLARNADNILTGQKEKARVA